PPKVDLLIVDEYQDLNSADIKFIKEQADQGVAVLAIGDDDQSIYGWRHADPSGIRRFHEQFGSSADYNLSVSRRCSRRILAAANELISSAPDRGSKPPLSTVSGSADGVFAYVKFKGHVAEAKAVAAMSAARVRAGVKPSDIMVLIPTR